MDWWRLYRADVRRYTTYSGGSALVQLLAQQGLWALLQYRLASAVYHHARPALLRRGLLLLSSVGQKAVEITTGISLPYTARIGPGLYLGHFGPIILNDGVVLGAGCNLSQGVTLGVSGRGARRGVPHLGDRVYVGANAVIVGALVVGDDAVVAANSLVTRDVPAHSTVMGVPAQVVNLRGSRAYLDPQAGGPQ